MYAVVELKPKSSPSGSPQRSRRSPDNKIIERHSEYLAASSRWENFGAKIPWDEDYHFVHSRHSDIDFQYNIDRYSRYLWKFYETKKWQEDYSKGINKIYGSKSPSKYCDEFQDVPTPRRKARSISENRYQEFPYSPSKKGKDFEDIEIPQPYTPQTLKKHGRAYSPPTGQRTSGFRISPDHKRSPSDRKITPSDHRKTPSKGRIPTKESDDKDTEKKIYQDHAQTDSKGRRTRKERQKEKDNKEDEEEIEERPYGVKKDTTPEKYKYESPGQSDSKQRRTRHERQESAAHEKHAGSKYSPKKPKETDAAAHVDKRTQELLKKERQASPYDKYSSPILSHRETKSPSADYTRHKDSRIKDSSKTERHGSPYEQPSMQSSHRGSKTLQTDEDLKNLERSKELTIRDKYGSPSDKKNLSSSTREPYTPQREEHYSKQPDRRKGSSSKLGSPSDQLGSARSHRDQKAITSSSEHPIHTDRSSKDLSKDYSKGGSLRGTPSKESLAHRDIQNKGRTPQGTPAKDKKYTTTKETPAKDSSSKKSFDLQAHMKETRTKQYEPIDRKAEHKKNMQKADEAYLEGERAMIRNVIKSMSPHKEAGEGEAQIKKTTTTVQKSSTTTGLQPALKQPGRMSPERGQQSKTKEATSSPDKRKDKVTFNNGYKGRQSSSSPEEEKERPSSRYQEHQEASLSDILEKRSDGTREHDSFGWDASIDRRGEANIPTESNEEGETPRRSQDFKLNLERVPKSEEKNQKLEESFQSETENEFEQMTQDRLQKLSSICETSPVHTEASLQKIERIQITETTQKKPAETKKSYETAIKKGPNGSGSKGVPTTSQHVRKPSDDKRSLPGSARKGYDAKTEQVKGKKEIYTPVKKTGDSDKKKEVESRVQTGRTSGKKEPVPTIKGLTETKAPRKETFGDEEEVEVEEDILKRTADFTKKASQTYGVSDTQAKQESTSDRPSDRVLEKLKSIQKVEQSSPEKGKDKGYYLGREPATKPTTDRKKSKEETFGALTSKESSPEKSKKSEEIYEHRKIEKTPGSRRESGEIRSKYEEIIQKPKPGNVDVPRRYEEKVDRTYKDTSKSPVPRIEEIKSGKTSESYRKTPEQSQKSETRYETSSSRIKTPEQDSRYTTTTTTSIKKTEKVIPSQRHHAVMGFDNVGWRQLNQIRAVENRAALTIQRCYRRFALIRRSEMSVDDRFRNEFLDLINHFKGFEGLYVKLKSTLSGTEANDKVIELALAFMSAYCTMKRPRSPSPRSPRRY